jgi:ribosomal protein L11 methyltransferase
MHLGARGGAVSSDTDLALRVIVPQPWAEVAGAMLRDRLGSYVEEAGSPGPAGASEAALVFYPVRGEEVSDAEVLSLLPEELRGETLVRVERQATPRDWVDGWKDHFHPIVIGRVRVRPPWEPALAGEGLVDVVINPGLGFGTGLHPTTRGALTLLQEDDPAPAAPALSRGALVDAGTGSGILSIAAAKLGWGPIIAFDYDAVALVATRENMVENGVADRVKVHERSVLDAPLPWFAGVTVLANMTLDPVLALLRRLADARPDRLVVAGILSGAQEEESVREAARCGFVVGRRLHETEWVSMELFPEGSAARDDAASRV